MNSQDDTADKSFEPTAQKLLQARKKGDIARSAELLTAASYFGLFTALAIFGYGGVMSLGTAMKVIIGQSAQMAPLFFDGAAKPLAGGLIAAVGLSVAPFFAVPIIAVMLVLFATRGIVFAGSKVQPKLSKISLIANAKNKYGRNGLFQFVLSFAKLVIYSICLAVFLYLRLNEIVSAISADAIAAMGLLAELCFEFLVMVVIVSAIIGGIDVIWQHFEHRRKNRMSRKEILDETKNSEGDPHVKQERRQRAQALSQTQLAVEVPKADVIIVNPTHYAVALRWDRNPGEAPVCIAKGMDETALVIREIAYENGVPIHSDPPAARALYATTDIGDEIAPEHYKAVAAAIRFAENIRRRAKKQPF